MSCLLNLSFFFSPPASLSGVTSCGGGVYPAGSGGGAQRQLTIPPTPAQNSDTPCHANKSKLNLILFFQVGLENIMLAAQPECYLSFIFLFGAVCRENIDTNVNLRKRCSGLKAFCLFVCLKSCSSSFFSSCTACRTFLIKVFLGRLASRSADCLESDPHTDEGNLSYCSFCFQSALLKSACQEANSLNASTFFFLFCSFYLLFPFLGENKYPDF